ncbi:MAG: DEAD/DEAH box helicase family protein [Cyanobacteria bacterium P01_G01_bin.54]
MPSNFDFLSTPFPTLHQSAIEAERIVYQSPRASCISSRFTLEQAVTWLYQHESYLCQPYDNKLGALIHERTFKENLSPPSLFDKVRLIHKLGNRAAHDDRTIAPRDALRLIEELYHFLYWLARYYSPNGRSLNPSSFDAKLIPQTPSPDSQKKVEQQLKALQAQITQLEAANQDLTVTVERQQATAQLKAQNQTEPDRHNYNEADTRKYLIDVLLREAGWTLTDPNSREYPVTGMPSKSGTGKVDYVLWGDDGKPLALVEAKRASRDPRDGKTQAKRYADCLEQQFGQRPLIFYTNGHETHLWDDRNYPERPIQGFLKKHELERSIYRRTARKPLHLVQPNAEIAGRSYQTEALKRITETFSRKHRKALLVMATGTGKTRTAIALVDLLLRSNWVNRTLFLADRKALVKQAKRAFTRHLSQANVVNLLDDPSNQSAAVADVVVSTYPTILNRIDDFEGNQRTFGAGHFDLVIVDEAHRSIYQKYRYLFDYFDSLLVGLTATPRNEIHRDTYGVFDLEPGVPSFAYELDDAIQDGYLVPPVGINIPFKFMRKGIRYADLSPDERLDYDDLFMDADTGDVPEAIDAGAINQWLFNTSTLDQALEVLMEQGLKTAGGDQLGKTIIFARNHNHAVAIGDRFNHNYPHYNGEFAQVIDSKSDYAESLLEDFSNREKNPVIAVSVDMLDTGVDVPEVVNLVFFKPVYSRVKFNQMIGRGTRLCEHLFGQDDPKREFFIFDLCSNFDYFAQEVTEKDPKPRPSLNTRLLNTQLQLSQTLPTDNLLRSQLLDDLHHHVAQMAPENFMVRRHLQAVETFRDRDRWNQLSPDDQRTISETLTALPTGIPAGDRLAKEFDLLCTQLQLALDPEMAKRFVRLRDQARDLLSNLEAKQSIPIVKVQLPLIAEAQQESWWEDITLPMIEDLRCNIRGLVKFVDRQQQRIVYTPFTDELLTEIDWVDVPIQSTGFSPYQYRKKVEAYIRAHEDHVAIAKLKRNLPLTEADLTSLETMLFDSPELESREQFETVFAKNLNLKRFIREIVGCDRAAAKAAFNQALPETNLTGNQIRFIENIIDNLTQQGVFDPAMLYEPPFTHLHPEGLDGVFEDEAADQVIALVRSFNQTVDVEFGAA